MSKANKIPEFDWDDDGRARGTVGTYEISPDDGRYQLIIRSLDGVYLGRFWAPYRWSAEHLARLIDHHLKDNPGIVQKSTQRSRDEDWETQALGEVVE